MLHASEGRKSFVVALDNEPAGQRGWQKAHEETLDWAGFKLSWDSPKFKDWNDDLIAAEQRLGVPERKKSASLKL
jgi:hypothetical protein